MIQIIFVLCLHFLGILLLLPLKKHIGFPFICLSGLYWGALCWVLVLFLVLIAHLPFPIMLTLIATGAIAIGSVGLNAKFRTWRLSLTDLGWLITTTLLVILVLYFFSQYSIKVGGYDAKIIIQFGRILAQSGLTPESAYIFSSWPPYVPLIQSASVLLGLNAHISVFQPLAGILFLALFAYSLWKILDHSVLSWIAITIIICCTLALATTYLFTIQIVYIHTNLLAAIYLFIAVFSLTQYLSEQRSGWLAITVLALLGFTLLRYEAPIFSLVLLVLTTGIERFSSREHKILIFAYMLPTIFLLLSLAIIDYHLYSSEIGSLSRNLTYQRVAIYIFGCLGAALLAFVSGTNWFKSYLRSSITVIIPIALAILWGYLFLWRPDRMTDNVYVVFSKLLWYGRWGAGWLIVTSLFIVFAGRSSAPDHRLIGSFLLSSVFLLFIIGGLKSGTWNFHWLKGSDGRIVMHFFPVTLFYVLDGFASSYNKRDS